ncbi:hypothetical protein GGI43DRAFT_238628 [Trichoderma evansii]
MVNSNFIATTSANTSDTWSRKANRGSPPPASQVGHDEAIQRGGPLSTEKSKGKNNRVTQNDALRGVGSQFATIDDQAMNKDLHIKL